MFCTQPFNHIDIIVENNEVMLQPCNVWTSKRFNIKEYQENLEDLKNTLSETYHYPGCKTCWNEDKKNIRSRRVAQNQFSNDNALSTAKLQSLGVRYGTLCNSKCMICSHHRSSSWVADAEKLGLIAKKKSLNSITFKRLNNKNLEFIKFDKVNISSSQLRKI